MLTILTTVIKILLNKHHYVVTFILSTKHQIKKISTIYKLLKCNGDILTFNYTNPKLTIKTINLEILVNRHLKSKKYACYLLSNTLTSTLYQTHNKIPKLIQLLNKKL
ncbi:hypothetical protein JSR02_00075 [Candidatus Vidania fulgoroideae]|uniref:Uncharacterized protein n=1 Tax=Candidatus Vidania fulgoroideorum TaxID=881286 RepID=A0A975AEE3_9PROT|nr:hypothetical protein JSR02_00075 [Candidatus Vidania fulgoroideae]